MTRAHLRFLVAEQVLGSAVFNAAINAGLAWLFYRSSGAVPLWGAMSVGGDTIVTSFLLPFFIGLVVTRVVSGRVREAKLTAFVWRRRTHPVLGLLPAGTLGRAIALGFAGLVLGAPVLASFFALGVAQLGLSNFVLFKAIYAGLLAAIFAPLSAICALGDSC